MRAISEVRSQVCGVACHSAVNDLTIPVAVFEHKEDNQPVRHDVSWSSLAQRLCTFDERSVKDGRAWSPVTYRPGTTRARDNVEEIHALVLDIDHSELPADLLNGLEYVAHTTFRHVPEEPRWRVVLPLTHSVAGNDWPYFWLRANAYFGGCVDPQTKDGSRIFYLPSCRPGAVHEAKQQHGLLLDPASLPDVPQYEARPVNPKRNGQIRAVPTDTLQEWAGRFAGAKLQELAHMQANTGRNAQCNRLAFLLGGLIGDERHGLEQSWVEQELFAACEQNNLVFEDGGRSVQATINSGLNAGLGQPWSPADQDDNWKPSPRLIIPPPVAPIDPDTGQELSPWRRAGELVRSAPEHGRQLVEGLLWEGRTHWVYSGPGAGKTLTWLAILLHVAAGRPFHGHEVIQGPVLIIEEDSPNSVIADYLVMLADIYDFDLDTIPLWFNRVRGVRLIDQTGLDYVRNLISQAPEKPLVVALDACERIVPSESFNSRELDPLSRLFTMNLEDQITNVMIDHTRKPTGTIEKPDPIDTLYGGRTKSAISDVMMHFSGAIKTQAVITFPKFRGDEPAPISINFDGASGFTLRSGKPNVSDGERLVMREINNSFGTPISKQEIATRSHQGEKTVQRAIARLITLGWVTRSGEGPATRFSATEHAPGVFG